MKRRSYLQTMGAGLGALAVPAMAHALQPRKAYVRLGGPLFEKFDDPDSWITHVKDLGYKAINPPLKPGASLEIIRAYEKVARDNDVVLAEVGAWSNPISPDPEEAAKAIEKCIASLVLADEIGARCCVNVSGSRNQDYWAGPHKDNFSAATFDLVVESTRKVIDAVKPKRSFFTLEAMPWAVPDSTESYMELLKAMDRKAFGVHLDPVNMVTSPRKYFSNGAMIKEMFSKLGPHVRSCHGKDIILREDNYTPHLTELRPGLGQLDYGVFLRELSRFKDVPLIMEHLKTAEAYKAAADYIRSVGAANHIEV